MNMKPRKTRISNLLRLTLPSSPNNQLKKKKKSLNQIGLLVLGKSSSLEKQERPMPKQKEKDGSSKFLIATQMRMTRPNLITKT